MIMVSHPRSTHYQAQSRDPQFQHLEHQHHSVPSTPSPPYHYAPLQSFAQQQQPTSVRSTPTSYPSPASYPSPLMPAYSFPQQGHHSPHFQSMNGSNFSLPPIRMTPPNTTLPPPLIQQQSGSPLPHPPQMYYGHGHGHGLAAAPPISHITSSPQPLRYPLPQVTPERIMSGGRHKKEIKRRTKTGCLTCRKRRIKCDEAHPTCKNCAKSKRECMGYDPIFKTQPGPAAIQPAPSSGGGTATPLSTPIPYGVPNTGIMYAPAMSTAGSSPASSCEPYEYPVIDPLLEATAPIPTSCGAMTVLAETPVSYGRPDLKRTYDRADRASPLSSISDTPRPSTTPMGRSVTPTPQLLRDHTNPAKRIKIDDLLTGGSSGLPLTPPSGDQSLQTLSMPSQISLYHKYASMLDNLLETGWFATRGLEKINRGEQFGEQLGGLFRRLQSRAGVYAEEEDRNLRNYGGDAEVLLDSLKLVYGTRVPTGDIRPTEQEDDYVSPSDIANRKETINRIAVVEALVTGRTRAIDLCSPPVSPKSSPPQFRFQIAENSAFWRPLARFVSLKEGKDPEQEFDAALRDMRFNTGGQRAREILCTIAEARHYNNRLQLHHSNGSETIQDRKQLQVLFDRARDIVIDMSSSPSGSVVDQIIRRISARAVMLWGVSISNNIFL